MKFRGPEYELLNSMAYGLSDKMRSHYLISDFKIKICEIKRRSDSPVVQKLTNSAL